LDGGQAKSLKDEPSGQGGPGPHGVAEFNALAPKDFRMDWSGRKSSFEWAPIEVTDEIPFAGAETLGKQFRWVAPWSSERILLTAGIIGMEVIESGGFKLGRVSDIKFDEGNWKVMALEVQLEDDVAKKHQLKRRFRKPLVFISVDRVQSVGDRVILSGSKEDLLKLIAASAGGGGNDAGGTPTSAPS
jgi:sporulation protein YlmC with PRC-barrel domain